jgi:hypothetical protein
VENVRVVQKVTKVVAKIGISSRLLITISRVLSFLSSLHTRQVQRVCLAAGCKINLKICFEVTVATAYPTIFFVDFQPLGFTNFLVNKGQKLAGIQ